MGRKNLTLDKAKLNFLIKLFFCFIFALILTGFISNKSLAANGKLYLSDIDNDTERTKMASGHILKKDGNDSDKIITLKIGENQTKSFVKGITAWATSEVVYDLQNYSGYDYFTAYVGVDISEQSNYYNTGARFEVYTSNDGQTWTKQDITNHVFYGWSVAEQIRVELNNARFLKLVTHSNSDAWWAEWYDETVFADAKLLKNDYVEEEAKPVDFIKTVEKYDEELKSMVDNKQTNTETYELTLLQREFVNNFGYDVLVDFVNCDEQYKDTVSWLMTSLQNMKLYVYGGEPDGNYIASMKALNSVYQTHKEDLNKEGKTRTGKITYSDLYRKMMITVSLTHSAQVSLWMQTDTPENQSTALKRYELFKQLHDDDAFIALKEGDEIKVDFTELFESLEVEEMRFVLNNIIDDESIIWLNEYVQSKIDANPEKYSSYLTPHPYMKYTDPNYANPDFHDESRKAEYDKKYNEVFTKYHVTWRPGLYKLWMNIEGGAVCGGISKIGSNIRGVNGIPSSVISQPGHAALIYYSQDKDGNGYWNIDNDVSGWSQSGKTERLSLRSPLGWGDDDYAEGWLASYVPLAQDAINNFDDYTASMRYVYLANSYSDDTAKQMELYREALKVMPINIDAWYGIIKLYEADGTKTNQQYLDLAEEIGDALKLYPLPMYNLTNRVKNDFDKNDEDYIKIIFKFTLFQTSELTTGTTWKNSTDTRPVKGTTEQEIKNYYTNWTYQPSITQAVSKFLLGQTDTELAKFSFDTVETVVKAEKEGEEDKVVVTAEAGVLKLSDRFKDSTVRWDYTLDGKSYNKNDYKEVTDKNEIELSDEELAKITADNDIYVHIVGTDYSDDTLYKIDILPQTVSSNIYANDRENQILGVDTEHTEWRYVTVNSEIAPVAMTNETQESEWTLYSTEKPKLRGNVSVEIRQKATGTKLVSESVRYDFTDAGEKDYSNSYVAVSHLSIDSVSTEEPGHDGAAAKAIDGNYNTRYHSNWNGQDTQRYMVIKVDRPIYLSSVEFVPAGGGNGKIVDGTVYGKLNEEDDWVKLSELKDQTYGTNINDPDFGKDPKNIKTFIVDESIQQEVQYIKIVADRTNGNWFTARMINIFQNLSKNPHPTASVEFSTTEPTTKNVEATVTNFSTDMDEIEMISGDTGESHISISDDKMTATFTENGKYTFKFKNTTTGHEGSAEANVTWIDRVSPTATIKYSTTDLTNGEVVATLVPDEEIIVTNNPHTEYNESGKTYTFTENGDFTFEYKDLAGNVGEPIKATVSWINSSSNNAMQNGPVLDPNQSGQEQPGTGDDDPGTTTPGEEEQNPGTTTPGGEEQNPGGQDTPGTGDSDNPSQTPGEQENPGTGDNDNPSNPGGEEDKPGTGDNDNPSNPGQTENPGTSEGENPGSGEQQNPSEEQKPGTDNDKKPGSSEEQKPGDDETPGTDEKEEPGTDTPEKQDPEEKPGTNKPSDNNKKPSQSTDTGKKDDSITDQKLPHTGRKIALISGISLATAWSVISYIRYERVGRKVRIGKSKRK